MAQFGYNPTLMNNPAFINAQGFYPNGMQQNFIQYNQNQNIMNMMRQNQNMQNGYQQMNNNNPGINGQRQR